jgi:hypothetical protein
MGKYVKISDSNESTFGNGSAMMAATSFTGIRMKSVSYPVDRGLLIEENIESPIPAAAYGGALKVSGSLEGNLRPKQMAVLFKSIFGVPGALAGTDPITSGTKYTLGEPLSMQLKIGENTSAATTDLELGYVGVGIKTCNLNIAAKEIVTAKFDWFAKLYTAASVYTAPTTGDYITENPCVFYGATVSLGGGATSAKIRSMTINIDRKIDEERYVIGDYTVQELGINGMTEVSGDITFTEKEYSEFRRALFGATGSSTLTTANVIGKPTFLLMFTDAETPATKVMYIYFDAINFGTTDTTMNGQNQIEKKVSYKATGSATGFVIGVAA